MSQTSYKQNHNRSGHSTDESAPSIDVGQWRQDVNAFAAATRRMLDSIHEELSNGLATGQAQVDVVPHGQQLIKEPEESQPQPTQKICSNESVTISDDVADECDQLLAKLKAQLSEQLNQ